MKQRSPSPPGGAVPSDVASWRAKRLQAAGFGTRLAAALAGDEAVGVHVLLELVDNGCPPELAARIAAPLESGRSS